MPKNKHLSGNLFTGRKLTIKETPLSASIADWLDAHSIYNDRLNCGKVETKHGTWIQLCKTGTPDRFAILGGRIIFVEVKQKNKKPSPEQLLKHDELRRAGAVVLTVDSFDSFISQFKALSV